MGDEAKSWSGWTEREAWDDCGCSSGWEHRERCERDDAPAGEGDDGRT